MNDIVERAKELAHRAHADQIDKAGRLYIEHVARVAEKVDFWPMAEAVAWLHDIAEDCPSFACEVSLARFPDEVYWAAHILNRHLSSDENSYYKRIYDNRLSFVVKLADIDDNSDEERLATLDDATATRLRKKYNRAKKALGV